MTLVNFHTHTTFSDGGRSLVDLVLGAKEGGLSYLSPTDHDTYKTLDPEVVSTQFASLTNTPFPEGTEPGIFEWRDLKIFRGVEYSFLHKGTHMHMVGLGLKYPGQEELKRVESLKEARFNRAIALAEEINEKVTQKQGIYAEISKINIDELKRIVRDSVPSRLHVGYLIAGQRPGMSTFDATIRYVNENLENYTISDNENLLNLRGTIDLIHSLGGVAVLPHIGRNHLSHLGEGMEQEVLAMYEHGLDAVEIQTGRASSTTRVHPGYALMVHTLNSKLGEKKLLVSLGDDDHGTYEGRFPVGGLRVPDAFPNMVEDLLERMKYIREQNWTS